MEHNFNYDEHEHEVYGGDIPDDAEMDADLDMSSGRADEEGYDAEPSNANSKVASPLPSSSFRALPWSFPLSDSLCFRIDQDLEDMKRRLKEIEEEAGALREMQAKVEKEMGAVQGMVIFSFHLCDSVGWLLNSIVDLGVA